MARRKKKQSPQNVPDAEQKPPQGLKIPAVALLCLVIGVLAGYSLAPRPPTPPEVPPSPSLDSIDSQFVAAGEGFVPCPLEITAGIQKATFASISAKIDYVREYVYGNSVHKIDAEWRKYAFDTPTVLAMLHQRKEGKGPPPHLSCGPRALVMASILRSLGIRSRLVHVFVAKNTIDSHTFLDVYNAELSRWETHDPDFNVFYTESGTSDRLSTLQIVLGALDSVTPQSRDKCGWEANKIAHLKADFFGALMYDYRRDKQRSLIFVNTDRFSPGKPFPKQGGTFYDFARTRYGNPLVLTTQTAATRKAE